MGDVELKVHCLERVDAEFLHPVVEQFLAGAEALGGVVVVPGPCTSSSPGPAGVRRCHVPG